jgi:non-heme chloroperoxidase
MSFIETKDGVRLYVQDWNPGSHGNGKPIVFIHGWPLSSAMWEYQMVDLTERGFRCIAYDRRGFGHSDKPYSGYDYKTMSADLAAVLDKLDVQDVTLVGFSMGGGEVVEYLARHNSKGRVTSVVLVASIIPFLLKTEDNPDGVEETVFNEMKEGLRKDRPGFLTDFTKKFYGVTLLSSPVSNAMLSANCELAMQASPKATLDCVTAFSATDFRTEAAAIKIPTLVIHGEDDATVPIGVSGDVAAKLIPGALYKTYPGAPHGLHYTHSVILNEDIAEFAEGRRRAASRAAE